MYKHAVNMYAYGIPKYYIYQCRVHAHNYELYSGVTSYCNIVYCIILIPTIVLIVLM